MKNFKNKAKLLESVTLNPDNFCPQRHIEINTTVQSEAQFDGHTWTEEMVVNAEVELAAKISTDLAPMILKLIREIDPFGGCCGSRKRHYE